MTAQLASFLHGSPLLCLFLGIGLGAVACRARTLPDAVLPDGGADALRPGATDGSQSALALPEVAKHLARHRDERRHQGVRDESGEAAAAQEPAAERGGVDVSTVTWCVLTGSSCSIGTAAARSSVTDAQLETADVGKRWRTGHRGAAPGRAAPGRGPCASPRLLRVWLAFPYAIGAFGRHLTPSSDGAIRRPTPYPAR